MPTAGAAGDAPEIGAGATSADAGASDDADSSGSAGEGGDASVAGSGGSAGSVAGAANGGGVGGAAQGGAAQGGAAQGGAAQGGAAQGGAAQGGAAQGGASQGGAPQGGSGGAVNVAGAPSDPNAGLMIPCDVAKTYTVCHNCHTSPPSNGAPFALVTLKDHQDYKNLEIGDVTFGIMPLEGTLSPADRTLMLAWLGAGAMGVPQAACP